MLNLEVLSGRVRERRLSPLEEAKAALIQRDLKELTTEQWQDFTDFFSAETQEALVKHQRQIQAGILKHASQCITSSACLPNGQRHLRPARVGSALPAACDNGRLFNLRLPPHNNTEWVLMKTSLRRTFVWNCCKRAVTRPNSCADSSIIPAAWRFSRQVAECSICKHQTQSFSVGSFSGVSKHAVLGMLIHSLAVPSFQPA